MPSPALSEPGPSSTLQASGPGFGSGAEGLGLWTCNVDTHPVSERIGPFLILMMVNQ